MKIIFPFFFLIGFTQVLHSQVPQKMSYQAVIRNSTNVLLNNKVVSMRIGIVQGSQNGLLVYSEMQNATTNLNGLVSLQIGTGLILSGNFAAIDWASGPYFIKTETDPEGGTNYSIAGTSELLSVPYALFALNHHINEYSGSSNDLINLSSLILGVAFTFHISPGLSFTPSGNILVSYSFDNHFRGTIVSYNKITGSITLMISEIVGTRSSNFWSVALDGTKGIMGDQGIQGPVGAIGPIGLAGLKGNAGTNGIDGSIGPMGLTGLKGNAGTNGIDGAIGLTGFMGYTGKDGINGSPGPIGQMGMRGNNGMDGMQGLTGNTGETGLTGSTGSFNGSFSGDISGTQSAIVVEKINGVQLSSLSTGIIKNAGLSGLFSIATAADFPLLNQNTLGTSANVSGIVLPVNGGTGIANENISTLFLPGLYPITMRSTDVTSIQLPVSGTLFGTAAASFSSAQLRTSLSDATGTNSSVFSESPVLTGQPLAPTAVVGTNTSQLATTAFVLANSGSYQSI